MSKFSEYLRQMIKKSGESVSAVSRSIGAERTSIHKALADERILSYKVVQNLARHFNLTIDERNEFFRLYYILLQGEDNFRIREAVCDLLNYLSTLQFHSTPRIISFRYINTCILINKLLNKYCSIGLVKPMI